MTVDLLVALDDQRRCYRHHRLFSWSCCACASTSAAPAGAVLALLLVTAGRPAR